MDENTAKINVELDAKGNKKTFMSGKSSNLMKMAVSCIDDVLKANYCCEGHFKLEKAAIMGAILSIEAPEESAEVSSND